MASKPFFIIKCPLGKAGFPKDIVVRELGLLKDNPELVARGSYRIRSQIQSKSFEDFINVIREMEIEINGENYSDLAELSREFEFPRLAALCANFRCRQDEGILKNRQLYEGVGSLRTALEDTSALERIFQEQDRKIRELQELTGKLQSEVSTLSKCIDPQTQDFFADAQQPELVPRFMIEQLKSGQFRLEEQLRKCECLEGNFVSMSMMEQILRMLRELEARFKKLEMRKSSNPQDFRLNFSDDKEFKGIFWELGRLCGGNVHENGLVEVTSSGSFFKAIHPSRITDGNWTGYWLSTDVATAFLCFDFKDRAVCLEKYSLRLKRLTWYIISWEICGSNDMRNWDRIGGEEETYALADGEWKTFSCSRGHHGAYFRYIRIHAEKNSKGDHHMALSNVEFYGVIENRPDVTKCRDRTRPTVLFKTMDLRKHKKVQTDKRKNMIAHIWEYNYIAGKEFNGIIDSLRKMCDEDLRDSGIIAVSSSGDSEFSCWDVTRNVPGRVWVSVECQSPWIRFDFREKSVCIDHYTIRCGISCPHEWLLQGSNDGRRWTSIHVGHIEELRNEGYVDSFDCLKEKGEEFFTLVQVIMNGVNFDSKSCLSFACIEFFGRVKIWEKSGPTPGVKEIHYEGVAPLKGILYELREIHGGNVHEKGIVAITSSGDYYNDYKPQRVADPVQPEGHGWSSSRLPNSWICFDFGNHRLTVSSYTLRSDPLFSGRRDWHPLKWVIEGSDDGRDWTVIDKKDTHEMVGKGVIRNFMCPNNGQSFRMVRLRQTGPNSYGSDFLVVSRVEFFGRYE
jgi:hypothetical protein